MDDNPNEDLIQVQFLDFLKFLFKKSAVVNDNFLAEVVETCRALCNKPDIKQLIAENLSEYCMQRTKEIDGYKSFVNFINQLLEKLEAEEDKFPGPTKHSNLRPRMVQLTPKQALHLYNTVSYNGSSNRSPELIFVTKELLDKLPNPEQYMFEWSDILIPWELRLASHQGFPSPPDSFTEDSLTQYHCLPEGPDIIRGSKMHKKGTRAFVVVGTSTSKDATSRQPSERRSNSCATGNSSLSSCMSCSEIYWENDSESENDDEILYMKMRNRRDWDPNAQIRTYASEMFCRGIYGLHSINPIVVDDVLWLTWFDRQNMIQSTGLNFIKDMPYFVALLVAFQRFGMAEWGVQPDLAPTSMFTATHSDSDSKSIDIKFGDILISTGDRLRGPGRSVQGRGTWVVEATSDSMDPHTNELLKDKKLVLKASWPEKSRLNEADIIEDAYAKLINSPDKVFIKNLPHVIAWRDIASSDTDLTLGKNGLDVPPAPKDPEPRVLRFLLFPRLLRLDQLGHYALWNKGVEHGDISAWNLMWDENNNCGILNDWDLAHVQGGVLLKSGQKKMTDGGELTGTLAFMARDILFSRSTHHGRIHQEPVRRLYRHEAESFIWVFTWICIKDDLEPDEIQWWKTGSASQISGYKCGIPFRGYRRDFHPTFPDAWEKCELLLLLLLNIDYTKLRFNHAEPDAALIFDIVLKIMSGELATREQVGSLELIVDSK
ncbi:hypothetical protein BDQ17DRAFT_1546841 [Cyathus striatus]|nr:hypothetical protein BDQ17DRAFT_1546841 [Cyathus striatus]